MTVDSKNKGVIMYRVISNRVINGEDYNYTDQLNSINLKNNDEIKVRFPDGTEQLHVIKMRNRYSMVWHENHDEAFIIVDFHGIELEIKIGDNPYIMAERINRCLI